MRFAGDTGCGLGEVLGLTTLKPGDSVVVCKRWDVDSRLQAAEQTPYTPTPKQTLYGTRATLKEITAERDAAPCHCRPGGTGDAARPRRRLVARLRVRRHGQAVEEGILYSIDPDPNDWYGYWCAIVTKELCAGGQNTLYLRLTQLGVNPPLVVALDAERAVPHGTDAKDPVVGATLVVALDGDEGDHKGRPYGEFVRPSVPAGQAHMPIAWSSAAAAGQARFLAGLQAFQRAGFCRRSSRATGVYRRARRDAGAAGAGAARHRKELYHGVRRTGPPAGRHGRRRGLPCIPHLQDPSRHRCPAGEAG